MTHEEIPLIHLENVSFGYPGRPLILKELSLDLFRKDRIGLVAPNGSGKTTLFHLVMGLLKPTRGKIVLFGRPMNSEKEFASVRPRIGLLFQDPDDQLFSPTVLEDVAFGPLNIGKSRQEAIDISRATLDRLGLRKFEDRITFKLSGGEKRLISLAAVLALSPEALLLDEPTGGLDEKTKERLVRILNELDLPRMVISHDFDFLSRIVDRIHTLENGRIHLDEELHLHVHRHAHKAGANPHGHV